MTISPKPKLKIKFSSKTTQVLKTGSCEASKQRWTKENCAPNVSLNGNKDSMRKELRKGTTPHSLDSLKLNGVDYNINDYGCPVRSSVKRRGPSGVIDTTVLNKRQKMDRSLKLCETTRHLCPRESRLTVGLALMMSMSFEEKRKLTKYPGEKVTDCVKISNARPANEEAARKIQNNRCPGKVLRKGTTNGKRTTFRSVKTIASFNVVATRCGSCGCLKCECSPKKGYAYESSNNFPSERYTEQNCVASKMEHESSLTSNTCKSDPESDVAVSALDEESNCSSPQPSSGTTAASADDWTPAIDLQLSPKKALRAAILKKRFADTILKAKQKQQSLLDHVGPINLRQEKEKLERQQQEEKAGIEDQIRAAKVASSLKAQEELILRREREREAARIALQKMEKTVEIEDNMKVLTELEIILFKARQGDRFGNIMERIGLFLKNDDMDYEDEEDRLFLQDLEEGEICEEDGLFLQDLEEGEICD